MAIRIDVLHPVTDEELAALSDRNPGYQFERTAEGRLVVAPTGSEGGIRSGEVFGQPRAAPQRLRDPRRRPDEEELHPHGAQGADRWVRARRPPGRSHDPPEPACRPTGPTPTPSADRCPSPCCSQRRPASGALPIARARLWTPPVPGLRLRGFRMRPFRSPAGGRLLAPMRAATGHRAGDARKSRRLLRGPVAGPRRGGRR